MNRSSFSSVLSAGFIGDPNSIWRKPGGAQIDWPNVADSYKNSRGVKELPAGLAVGNLLHGSDLKVSPRVVTTNPAIGLLETTACEDDPTAALSGYGIIVGGVINENMLPTVQQTSGYGTGLLAAIKTELATANCQFYYCFKQADSRIDYANP